MIRLPDVRLCLVVLTLLSACDGGAGSADPGMSEAASGGNTAAGSEQVGDGIGVIKIKDGAGKAAWKIKPKADGCKVVDGGEAEVFRLKAKPGKVKVKGPDEKTLCYVKASDKAYKIKSPDQETTHFKFQRQSDGDWKLEDGAGKLVCKLKKRDYGWTMRGPGEVELGKIKVKAGKTSLRDAADKTLLSTKDAISSLAFAALGLPGLSDAQRLGLLYELETSR